MLVLAKEAVIVSFKKYLLAEQGGEYVNTATRTIFTFARRCNRIEQAC